MSVETSTLSRNSDRAAFATSVAAELRADLPLFLIVALYAILGGLLALWLGASDRFVPLLYAGPWTEGLVLGAVFYLILWEIPRAARRDPARPLAGALRSMAALPLPRVAAGVMLFMAVAVFHGTFTSIKNMLPLVAPFTYDRALADLDVVLHGGVDPWRLLQPLLGHPWISAVIETLYSATWGLLLYAVPAVVALHAGLARVRTRFFLAFFATWAISGNLVALAGMSAGPAFYGAVTGDAARFQELTDYLAYSKGSLHSASSYQDYLWLNYVRGTVQFATGISAFPSLHLGMATLYVCLAAAYDRRLALVAGLFWCAIMVGSVHLAWHYAVDGYAATAMTLVLWFAAGPLARRWARPRTTGMAALQPRPGD